MPIQTFGSNYFNGSGSVVGHGQIANFLRGEQTSTTSREDKCQFKRFERPEAGEHQCQRIRCHDKEVAVHRAGATDRGMSTTILGTCEAAPYPEGGYPTTTYQASPPRRDPAGGWPEPPPALKWIHCGHMIFLTAQYLPPPS